MCFALFRMLLLCEGCSGFCLAERVRSDCLADTSRILVKVLHACVSHQKHVMMWLLCQQAMVLKGCINTAPGCRKPAGLATTEHVCKDIS